jgi:hypothetical protein
LAEEDIKYIRVSILNCAVSAHEISFFSENEKKKLQKNKKIKRL